MCTQVNISQRLPLVGVVKPHSPDTKCTKESNETTTAPNHSFN